MKQPRKPGKSINSELSTLRRRLALLEKSDMRQLENRQKLSIQMLELLNQPGEMMEAIRKILLLLKEHTGFECIGIRLKRESDFPYYVTNGFPEDFIEAERYLCARTESGELIKDAKGNPVLECMCGNVIQGRTNSDLPFFTKNGSFWSNCTTKLLASTTEKERQARTRNRCNAEGYESVALIPLRTDSETIGLLQLNDSRKNMFTPTMIIFFERIGASIGIAFKRNEVMEELRKLQAHLGELVASRTAELQKRNEQLQQEIAERKQAIEKIKHLQQSLQTMFDYSPFTIMIVGKDKKIRYVNKSGLDLMGYKSMEEVAGQVCHNIVCPAEINKCPIWDLNQKVDKSEKVLIKKDETRIPILKSVIPIVIDGEDVLLEAFIDITERKKLEGQLIQSQKMEAVGILAGGVAHDFNNILTVIQGYAELALMDMAKNDPLFEHMGNIFQAAQRAAELTRQLLIFGRKQHTKLSDLDINRTITNLLKMLTRLIGEDITITTDLASDLPADETTVESRPSGKPNMAQAGGWGIKADKGNIEQVIMNLVVNARDAMPKGGKVIIKTENVTIDQDYCRTNTEATAGQFVRLSVTDNGIGMDKEIMKHLFEPFFSTKDISKGGGLGLSVVYGIVKQHQGWINVYSEPGHGTIFKIYLPVMTGQIEKKTEKSITIDTPEGNGERILLVEDEASVRELGIAVLEKHNYVVFAAATAQEAKQLYEREKGKFHLIFSDTILPDGNGLELVNQLRVYNPELPVLMCSGYSNEKIQKAMIQEKQMPFLQKPYGIIDMLRVVKETIKSK